jgi:3-deoxy-D-manno-octulosonic-acid transferase
VLLDTIGELRAVYPLAEVVFVGGSIAPTGGHNVLEPALAARCVVTGAHTFNFTAIVRSFIEQEALVQLPALAESEAPAALARVLAELLADDEERRAVGERARAALEMNRGATARTVQMLAPILNRRPEVTGRSSFKDEILTSNL